MSNVHALVEAPVIYLNCCGSLSVRILGQEQLDAFFAKIERGGLPGASDDEKRHCIQAKEIKKLDCDGKEVPDDKKIEQLPKEIGKLTSLTWLDLENNQLTSLPGEIGKLTNICERRNCRKYLTDHDRFDVAYNFINYIPREFRDYPGFSNAFDNSVFLDSPPVPQPDKAGVVILNHPQDRIWLSDKFRKNPEFKKRVKCIEYREIFEGGGPPQSCVVGCWPTDAGSPPENKVTIGFESRDQLENFVFE
ncbi:leucine-rich repeat domain-containing protein, partial [bacterium]|nr:leucine-rich repeat domain-containing protein [bacterium]